MTITNVEALPNQIKSGPHWRVNFRPGTYEERLPRGAAQAFELVRETQLNLRGWPYPFVSDERAECIRNPQYVASGVAFLGHTEYWRLYFSGQFIHLFSVREKTSDEWNQQLRHDAGSWAFLGSRVDTIPGFIDVGNLLYNMTEIFEFAARLCQKKLYEKSVDVSVELRNVKGFALLAQYPRFWHGYFPATSDHLPKSENIPVAKLLAESRELALQWAIWFFGQFGWDNPSIDVLRDDQEKLLARKL